ncbi:putative aldo-keto reductase [Polychaeton citri CBS 116435]|uniref:Aldo-keto reductase n=1 Tax=Polychaeton citri CBS 116435 TaxID=1314669 RepID=A0A9P4UHV2_9PEZI|nr:putative aldo-keto reductase [Polychaeton citri CBS 116435]
MAAPPSVPASIQKSLSETKVSYTRLGSSGLRVSVPVLGGMSLGSKSWADWVLEEPEATELLKAAWERGINTWDTASMYSNGVSEEIIGRAIKTLNIPREKVVIMTKHFVALAEEPGANMYRFPAAMESRDFVNAGGLSRASLFAAVDASLARLQTSYIDLFQIHRFDPSTPIAETMKALHDLVATGKIRYIGASSMWATQFAQMQAVAERNGWTSFVSMQNYYNLCYREEEREMNRFCAETGVGLLPYSPLYSGRLARPAAYRDSSRSKMPSPMDSSMSKVDEEIIGRVQELAERKGWKMSQVALAWLLAKGKGKGLSPIVGFNSPIRIDDVEGLSEKALTDEDVAFLEELYVPKSVRGHF